MYPVVIFEALPVKIRDEGLVRNKSVYLALGVDHDGRKDVLGPLFAHPPEIRRLLCTSKATESPHMQLRKILKARGHFTTD
jgi:transposase-like protein